MRPRSRPSGSCILLSLSALLVGDRPATAPNPTGRRAGFGRHDLVGEPAALSNPTMIPYDREILRRQADAPKDPKRKTPAAFVMGVSVYLVAGTRNHRYRHSLTVEI